ncbi:MAG: hypothetical protein Ct9H300mP11_18740 [Chloroflexota bacterium]|nr:MAG: hypothetical protein Ct9H300mP11_18740 [Chloroflexota bacterium]
MVIQGAGMNMRGKVQLEIFGAHDRGEMNEQIVGYGKELDMDIELFHSNVEGEVINHCMKHMIADMRLVSSIPLVTLPPPVP